MDKEEFDIEDLRYYKNLDAKKKLEWLLEMNKFLQKITPQSAVKKNEKLKDTGF